MWGISKGTFDLKIEYRPDLRSHKIELFIPVEKASLTNERSMYSLRRPLGGDQEQLVFLERLLTGRRT